METGSWWLTGRCRNEVLALNFYQHSSDDPRGVRCRVVVLLLARHLASTGLLWASIDFVPVALPTDPLLPCLTAGDTDKHRCLPLTENTLQPCHPNPSKPILQSLLTQFSLN